MPLLSPDQDQIYMRIALAEAQKAALKGEVPIGAVLVSGNKLIAKAHNLVETLTDPTAHAEILVITGAAESLGSKLLTDCTVYVTVEPCVMCAGALGLSRICRLVFGCAEEKTGFQRLAPSALHPRCEVLGGVLADEAKTIMRAFFEEKRHSNKL